MDEPAMDFEDVFKMDEPFLQVYPKPRRPMAPFWRVGGKGNLVFWLMRYAPFHEPDHGIITYVEPFEGAASLFFALEKPPPVVVLNDIDGDIVNFFRVLQDFEKFRRFLHLAIHTPYSRAEWRRARAIIEGETPAADDVERAWAFYVVANMSMSGIVGGGWALVLSTYAKSQLGVYQS